MAEHVGSWALLNWFQQRPLTDAWARISDAAHRERILRWWIRASESDEWTFAELRSLLAYLLAAGEVPGPLAQWGLEVAAERRRPPARSGPKGNRTADFLVAFEAKWRNMDGESMRSIHRDLARRIYRTEDAVRDAVKRGFRTPRGG